MADNIPDWMLNDNLEPPSQPGDGSIESEPAPPAPKNEEPPLTPESPEDDLRELLGLSGPHRLEEPFWQPDDIFSSNVNVLRVTESQKDRATLLANMIRQDDNQPPISAHRKKSAQPVLRWVIALVLMVSMFVAAVAPGTTNLQLGPEIAAETLSVNQQVMALALKAPVLVAVDFQPGYQGEMLAAAAPLFDHLMSQQAYLVLVSTLTNGPAMSEYLMTELNQDLGYDYQPVLNYVNMGFIPGGPIGMSDFAADPSRSTPLTVDGIEIWDNYQMEQTNLLASFGMVVVLTDSADTARQWIEQVNRNLGDIPMILVVSAQAAPMVRPYYYANPRIIEGLISGISGAEAYATLTGDQILARPLWSAFSVGTAVSVVLLILGAIFTQILINWERRYQARRGSP